MCRTTITRPQDGAKITQNFITLHYPSLTLDDDDDDDVYLKKIATRVSQNLILDKNAE
jgi:hypothetical protein